MLLHYSSVENIDAAQERALRELKIRLSILASNQRMCRSRLESLFRRVADTERRGDAPLEQPVDAIAALRVEIEKRKYWRAPRTTDRIETGSSSFKMLS